MQGPDLNQRPPGYEPDELPDCSTLRHYNVIYYNTIYFVCQEKNYFFHLIITLYAKKLKKYQKGNKKRHRKDIFWWSSDESAIKQSCELFYSLSVPVS